MMKIIESILRKTGHIMIKPRNVNCDYTTLVAVN